VKNAEFEITAIKSVSDAVTSRRMAFVVRDALSSQTIKRNAENVATSFATGMLGYLVLSRTNAVVYLSASSAEK
jgi:ethanolamine ammonia-lyase small subunit